MRLGLAHEPGRSVNGGAPRGLLWFGVAIGRLVGSGLDLVEVDVPVLIALLLVELDPNPAALQLLRTLANRLAESGVLVAGIVAQHEAQVAAAGLERAYLLDGHDGFHGGLSDTRVMAAGIRSC